MNSYVYGVLKRTDWEQLRQQKQELIKQRAVPGMQHVPGACENLSGLIHFLDALQDAVVEDGIAAEKEVFGHDW